MTCSVGQGGCVGDGSSLVGSPLLKKFPEGAHGFEPIPCGLGPSSPPLLLPHQAVPLLDLKQVCYIHLLVKLSFTNGGMKADAEVQIIY